MQAFLYQWTQIQERGYDHPGFIQDFEQLLYLYPVLTGVRSENPDIGAA